MRQTAEGLTLKWSSPSVLRSTHSATSKELKKTQNLMMGLKYSAETNMSLVIKFFVCFGVKFGDCDIFCGVGASMGVCSPR